MGQGTGRYQRAHTQTIKYTQFSLEETRIIEALVTGEGNNSFEFDTENLTSLERELCSRALEREQSMLSEQVRELINGGARLGYNYFSVLENALLGFYNEEVKFESEVEEAVYVLLNRLDKASSRPFKIDALTGSG